MDYQISLIASAIRTQHWMKFYDSIKGNKINIEIIFTGNRKPDFQLPPNFKWIEANVKPAQCYEIAAIAASGEIIGWVADDCVYNIINPDNLDRIYNFYKSFNTDKIVVAQRPIEDGRDVWHRHHFFGDWSQTPVMAPLGFMNRELFHKIGGYDRNFISGQSENDIVMRVLELGGKVERSMDSFVHIFHQECHERRGPQGSGMRKYYVADREVLENLWIREGYGSYGTGGKMLRDKVTFSKTRLKPVESFENNETITQISQGPKGLADPPWN